jgi:hypothetical protein
MDEAVAKCNMIKTFEHNKIVFLKETELSWEDAVEKIPQFTTQEKIGGFALKATSKELPPEFKVATNLYFIDTFILFYYYYYCILFIRLSVSKPRQLLQLQMNHRSLQLILSQKF